MDIDRLRYFSVVAASGSITRAAGLLNMTQPALSKAMRVLEREVGMPLVQRKGRGMELTDAGRYLAGRIEPILAAVAAIPDELATRTATITPLRFASHESFGTYFVRLLLARDACLEFEHRYMVPGAIEQAVADSNVDVGISYIPVPTAGVEHLRAATIQLGVFARPEWSKRRFADWRFAGPVLPPLGAAIRAQGLDGWPDDRVPRTVSWRVSHTETALELCRQGRAVACFPAFLVDLHNEHAATDAQLERVTSDEVATQWSQPVYAIFREGAHPRGLESLLEVLGSLD